MACEIQRQWTTNLARYEGSDQNGELIVTNYRELAARAEAVTGQKRSANLRMIGEPRVAFEQRKRSLEQNGEPVPPPETLSPERIVSPENDEEWALVDAMRKAGLDSSAIQAAIGNLRNENAAGGLLARNVSIAAQAGEPTTRDLVVAHGLLEDLAALPKDGPWTPEVIDRSNPQLRIRLAQAGMDDLVGWEGKVKALRQAGASEETIAKLRSAAVIAEQPAINTRRTLIAPNGEQIELPLIAPHTER